MLFLGHFVVVNWSEQLGVMQVMELLFSFHLLGLCACVSKQREARLDMGKRTQQEEIRPDDGQNEGNIKPEHSEGICTGVTRFFKHQPAPFTFSASNSESGISINVKYFSRRMLFCYTAL